MMNKYLIFYYIIYNIYYIMSLFNLTTGGKKLSPTIWDYLQDEATNEDINKKKLKEEIIFIRDKINYLKIKYDENGNSFLPPFLKDEKISDIVKSKKLNISEEEYKELISLIFNIKLKIQDPTTYKKNDLDDADIEFIENILKQNMQKTKFNLSKLDSSIVYSSKNQFLDEMKIIKPESNKYYQEKYLKYKSKYLELKQQRGGISISSPFSTKRPPPNITEIHYETLFNIFVIHHTFTYPITITYEHEKIGDLTKTAIYKGEKEALFDLLVNIHDKATKSYSNPYTNIKGVYKELYKTKNDTFNNEKMYMSRYNSKSPITINTDDDFKKNALNLISYSIEECIKEGNYKIENFEKHINDNIKLPPPQK